MRKILWTALYGLVLLGTNNTYGFINLGNIPILGDVTQSITDQPEYNDTGYAQGYANYSPEPAAKQKKYYSFKSLRKMALTQLEKARYRMGEQELNKHISSFEEALEEAQDEVEKYRKKLVKKPTSKKYTEKLAILKKQRETIENKLNLLYELIAPPSSIPSSDTPRYEIPQSMY